MWKDTLSMGVSVSLCSFCDKPEDQIASLTAGPGGFSICCQRLRNPGSSATLVKPFAREETY